ncbi:FAD binding domain-containing protein [Thalassiella azotivora]
MDLVRPRTWSQALAARADEPGLVPVCGGTDVMVEINLDRSRPSGLLDLTAVPGLASWSVDGGWVRIGPALTYRAVVEELGDLLPGLAAAARTVGSPQIRNRGTVAGNLASASPAGDCHPPLLAAGAVVECESVRGRRDVPVDELFTGPKRTVLAPDELVAGVRVPTARGPQPFAKVGTRNAMVIAVVSFALAVDVAAGRARTGIGSAGPTPLRARAAEDHLATTVTYWHDARPLPSDLVDRFADLVVAAAAPRDDLRGTAAYRRHALRVLARRCLTWAWHDRAPASGDGRPCA